jgi:hypothetical protein
VSPALRRHGTTLALLVACAGAGGALWFVERGSVTTDESVGRARKLLPAFHGDDVTEVKVVTGGRSARVFRGDVNAAGQRPWQIEIDGAREPAEEMAVDQLLGSLRDGAAERKQKGPLDATDRRTFGLDAPHGEIAVAMGRQSYRVLFGGPATRPPGAMWVEVEGQWAAVITAQLAAALQVTPDSLRRKALVTWEASALDALALDGAGGPRHLVRASWKVPRGASFRFDGSTPEGKVRASAAALDRVWEALGRMTADAFLTGAEADEAPPPALTVTLTPHGSKPVILHLGGACPGHPDDVIAVRREEGAARVAACVPHGVLEALSLPASELADLRLVGARADEVVDLKLQQGALALTIARTGAQWHEQTPVDRPIEPEVGRAFLERLIDAQATKLSAPPASLDAAGLGLDPPRATVRIASTTGDGAEERIELLDVGAEHDGVVHVLRTEDGVLADVPASAAAALFPDEMVLRGRKVLDLPPTEFHGLRVTGPLGVQRFERGSNGLWTLLEPRGEGLSVDPGMLSEVAEAVAGLSAERWVGTVRPEHGLDRPRLVIAADVGAGATARSVEVDLGAPAGGGGSFARVAGDPTVFVAPRRLETAADRWMLDRTALLADVERMTRVTLAADDGKKLVLERSAGEGALHVVGAAAGPEATARAASVRDALGDLVADGAVSVGPALPAQGLAKPALRVTVEQDGKRLELSFGAGDAFHGTGVFYVRREGFAATFVVARARVLPLLEAVKGS